ncbi:MAG: glycosyltransferase family 39 protein [Anaerolineae bacterium]
MSRLVSKAKHAPSLVGASLLILILCFAFGLRLAFFFKTNRIVDEYISMLSIQAILDHGVPVLPSGLFYGPKGVLHSYIGALAAWVFGASEFVFGFPSVLAGVLAVSCIYRVGREWFSPVVGATAAMALAWLPSAVQWGGRVRMYSLWQLLSLVSVYLLVNGYLRESGRRARVAGIFVMLLAVLSHTLALLTLGGLAAGIAASWLISPSRAKPKVNLSFWEVLVIIILIIVIIILNPVAGPWGAQEKMSDAAQGDLTIQNVSERVLYLVAFTHEFVTWPLWPLTLFYAAGFIRLFLRLLKKSPTSGDWVAVSLYVLVLCAWSATSILSFIQRDRYLFGILPFYLLLASRELCSLGQAIAVSVRPFFSRSGAWGVAGVISLLLLVLLAPSTFRLMGDSDSRDDPRKMSYREFLVSENTSDYVAAYLYVRDHSSPDDTVAACHPAPSQWILGYADYYVVEYGAEVHQVGNEMVDNWAGTPLIDSPEKFALVLDNHTRVWYLLSEKCWEYHLGDEFKQLVQQNMQIVFDQSRMRVFVSSAD